MVQPSTNTHRRGLQQRRLGVLQQAQASLDRGPQGVLALGQVHRAGPSASSDQASRGERPGLRQQPHRPPPL